MNSKMERFEVDTLNCEFLRFKDPTLLIQKIISLMEEQMLRNEFHRHKEYIDQLSVTCQKGFALKDLHDISVLMELLLNRIDEVEEYSSCMDQILRICAIPPMMTLSSDILIFVEPFKEYLRMLGYSIICLKSEELQIAAAQALSNVLSKHMQDRRYVSVETRIDIAANSQLPEILGHLLELAEETVYPILLNVIIILVRNSETVCYTILRQDAINSLLARLEPTWKERYPDKRPPSLPVEHVLHYNKVAIIVLILLKYLTNNKEVIQEVQPIEPFSLWSLQYTFRFFARTNQYLDRNNILIILIKILFLFPDTDFVTSGLAKDLTCIGLNTAYNMPWAKDIKLSMDDNDCLYMEMVIFSMPLYINFFGGIRVLEEQRIIYKLLAIARNQYTIKWKRQEACVLSRVALNTIMNLVPYTEEEFIENGGPTVFLKIIETYKKDKDSDENILAKCLEAVLHIIKNTTMVLDSFVFNNGIALIMDLCEDMVFNRFEHSLGKRCLSAVFFILCDLFSVPSCDSKRAVKLLIEYMKKIVKPKPEAAMRDTREIIAAMNFVWKHIVKHVDSAKEFVEKDGVYLMLDMIEIFPFAVRLVTLGALIDLCEYGNTIPYLITWKYEGQTILPLLMKIFREENKQLKVKVGPHGQITDARYPLMGKDQWFLTFCTCKPLVAGHACLSDLYVSCRPKVYAMLQMLYERQAEKVEIANEYYKTFDETLQPEDQITRLVAENFLTLKLGEAWVELKEEFDRSSISLTAMDYKLLTTLTHRAHKIARYLRTLQNDILIKGKEKDRVKEYCLYKHLQDGKLTEALQMLSELKGIARCSEHLFRISEKYKQYGQIENSIKNHSVSVHRTYFSDLRVTPVFNQIIEMQKFTSATSETSLALVSPTESNKECNVDISEDLLYSPSETNLVCQE